MRRPCQKCGEPKRPGRGQKFCEECHENAVWRKQTKYRTRVVLMRSPCEQCGGVKEPGHGRRFCKACRPDELPPRLCPCGTVIERPLMRCDECKAVTAEREKVKHRVRSRRRRDAARAAGTTVSAYYPRSEKARLRDNETRRIKKREKAEREGRTIPELPDEIYRRRYGTGRGRGATRVPAAPLLELFEGVELFVMAEAIGVSESFLSRIVHGRITEISIPDADKICQWFGVPLELAYGEAAA